MARDVEVLSARARIARALLSGYAAAIYVFLFAPIVLLVLFSFNANRYGTFPITGWTLKWYGQAFHDYQVRDAVATTLKVAAAVTLVSTVVGTAAAFPLVRSRLPFRSGVRIAFTLPIMIPGLLIGVSLLVLFTSTLEWQLSPETAVIGQSVYTTPFVALRRIMLPQIKPGITTAVIFVFIPILGEYLAPQLVGGARGVMIGNLIVNFFSGAQYTRGAAAALLIAALIVVLLIIFRRSLEVEDATRA